MTQTVEDYLKALFSLGAASGTIGTNQLADKMDVTPGTVTSMLKSLSADGYIDYTPRKGCTLTVSGRHKAVEIVRRHRILEHFLHTALKMNWADVHQEAEALEHSASAKVIELMDSYMGHPQYDPHGHPIPGTDGDFPARKGTCSLNEARSGRPYRIVEISDDSHDFLRYLDSACLALGSVVTVREPNSASEILIIDLEEPERTVPLSLSNAGRVMVSEVG
jgi:DtxR family Mn-dependent transcriptional regulator